MTAQKRPTLYWHLSEATHKPVVLTLIDLDSVNPLLEEPLQGSVSRGIHALKLADYDIRLQTNKTYEWSVRIVEDPNDPSGDAVARSFIKRVNPNAAILAILEDNNPLSRAQGYARNGIWHDALAALSEDGSPIQVGNRFLHIRDRLLAQVGLLHMLNTPRASVASNSRVR